MVFVSCAVRQPKHVGTAEMCSAGSPGSTDMVVQKVLVVCLVCGLVKHVWTAEMCSARSPGSSDMVVQKVVVDGAWRKETGMGAVAWQCLKRFAYL